MHTLGDMAKALNRSAVYLHSLQSRFSLPTFEGAAYSDAYLAFLRTIICYRSLNVSEEALLNLWNLEKKLLQLLHVDSAGSPTWFLDACGKKTRQSHRLLLTNHDMGVTLVPKTIQLGLNFSAVPPELFAGKDMGEDALRVLAEYLRLYTRIQTDVTTELPIVQATKYWIRRLDS